MVVRAEDAASMTWAVPEGTSLAHTLARVGLVLASRWPVVSPRVGPWTLAGITDINVHLRKLGALALAPAPRVGRCRRARLPPKFARG